MNGRKNIFIRVHLYEEGAWIVSPWLTACMRVFVIGINGSPNNFPRDEICPLKFLKIAKFWHLIGGAHSGVHAQKA